MNVKIETKEKFTVITPQESRFSANMTEAVQQMLLPYLQKDIPHVVLNLSLVNEMDLVAAEQLAIIQQQFYDEQHSFVICCLQPQIEQQLDDEQLLEGMNVTPTESEAWDMVQMEEIERELLGDE